MKNETKMNRTNGEYRLRVGMESNIVDTVKVGFGLATGSGDPRITTEGVMVHNQS